MIIYRPDGSPLTDILVDDESYHFAEIMGRDDVTLYFSLPQYMEFPVGCYVTYMAKNYTLYSVDKMRMEHRRDFEYTITFESNAVELENFIYSNPNDGRFKFPMTAKPQEHLALLCLCLTDKTGVTWTYVNTIDSAEKTISYDAMTCLDTLKQIADTFETEYRIDGTTIHLGKVEFFKNIEAQIALSYGKGNGLRPGVEKVMDNSEKIIGKVYIQGGDRNVDFSQYGSATLLLPKSTHIWYDGVDFYSSSHTGATEFVTSQDGRFVALASNDAPLAEGALDLSDIYPSYDHEVSTAEEVDAENHLWDIYSDTFTAGTSTATKVNYGDALIANDGDMTIIFQSGALSGREFGVYWKTKEVTSGGTTQTVAYMEIVPSKQDGFDMPDRTSGFCPNPDDVFRVFNVYLPDSYILSAENEMLHQAVSYLYEHCREKFSIKGEVDPIWSASQWLNIGGHFKPGAYFRFSDPVWADEGVSIRITSVKTFINKPHIPIVELSNSIGKQGVSSALKRIEAEAKVLPESVKKDSISFTKRSFADAKETMAALAEAMLDGFSEQISPITVQTMQAIVGDESLQIKFWTDRTCTTPILNPLIYNPATKQLTSSFCALQHMTLGITDIKPSSSREVREYLRWNIASYESAVLDDPSKYYYVYSKCDALNSGGSNHISGEFVMSETAIPMERDVTKNSTTGAVTGGYYHFFVGILNSERDNNRSFAPVYGYTEILPGQITTDVIRNSSGNSFWDLTSGALNIDNKLKYNVNGDGSLVLNGTFVQTGSGDVTTISAWCGAYVSSTRYQKGDEVFYQEGDAISTYRYKSDIVHDPTIPATVHPPTDSDYWEATSVGAEGGSGQGVFKSIVFKRSESTPSTPPNGTTQGENYGGTYLNPIPYGWSDGVPSGTEILWMSTRVFTSNGDAPQEAVWTTPQRATSGDEIQYMWSTSTSKPSSPDSGGEATSWTASTSNTWIHITSGGSGSSSGTISYTVDPYELSGTRTGTIVVTMGANTRTFTIQQSGTGTQIEPLTVDTISASGGTQLFSITAGTSVSWTLTSSVNWITLSSGSGTGNANVTATIASSSDVNTRSGVLTFKEGTTTIATITINQEAYNVGTEVSASYSSTITSAAQNIPINISDPDGHGWQFSIDECYGSIVTGCGILSGSASMYGDTVITGTGNASVYVSVSENTAAGYRWVGQYGSYPNYSDSTTHSSHQIQISQNGQ